MNVDASYSSFKPLKRKYRKILALYSYEDNQVACIGDGIITDIYGANRMGFTSILVNPLSKADTFTTKFFRLAERFIYRRFKRQGLLKKGVYYD